MPAGLFKPGPRERTASGGTGGVARRIASASSGNLDGCDPELTLGRGKQAQKTKRVVLIRHGRSTWNEFLGHHKKSQWEEQERSRKSFRGAVASFVWRQPQEPGAQESTPTCPGAAATPLRAELAEGDAAAGGKPPGGFWPSVRGGVKHAANALLHAGKLNQVDHPLSAGGLAEGRALRASISAAVRQAGARSPPGTGGVTATADGMAAAAAAEGAAGAGEGSEGGSDFSEAEAEARDVLLQCRHWFISPFLRALQTAAYGLSPLLMREETAPLTLRVTPQCNEVVRSRSSFDCQGKKDNIGFRVAARALGKLAETMEEEEPEDPERPLPERQEEMTQVAAVLCALVLEEVDNVWWNDISQFKKENIKMDDMRIRRLVARLLKHEAECLGIVAHSLIFQRMLQLFCPYDPITQEELRASLRNGAPTDTKDPFKDKMMNCGVLVITFRYYQLDPQVTVANRSDAQIVAAQFLFGGHMEGASAADKQTVDLPDDAEEGFEDVNELLAAAASEGR